MSSTRNRPTPASRSLRLQQTLYCSANPTRRWLHRLRYDWICSRIAAYFPSGGKVAADLGAGLGYYLPLLVRRFETVFLLDRDIDLLRHHAPRPEGGPRRLAVLADVGRLPLATASADLVLCSEVLEHLESDRPVWAEMRRVLRPGGLLILSTPQPWSLLETTARLALTPAVLPLVRRIYREPVYPTGHVNLISPGRLQRKMKKSGLTVLEFHRSGLYIPFLAEMPWGKVQQLAARLDPLISRTPLAPLLWTQFYVAAKTG